MSVLQLLRSTHALSANAGAHGVAAVALVDAGADVIGGGRSLLLPVVMASPLRLLLLVV